MPVVTITLMEGYDDSVRTALGERLTDAVRATIAAPLDGITVQINEVKPTGYMRGRERRKPGAPVPDAATVVRDYLAAMEARDLGAAKAMLADDFVMHFPGTGAMRGLDQLLAWAKERYAAVGKTYECFDVAPSADGVAVYCYGMLAGEWLDGASFKDIRFIDRFTVRDGKLVDQRVWNDMGETMLQAANSRAAAE
ncbi:MAG TPA: nuclear transport factor 2 family protein [Alphaproteobacteria bacterium]|nr:nuclear transport factor 2 family protein [Alphaproteobacteria bacterium]